ncbi:hypothetical protein FB45DRAFT_955684 [Roridomyces roridus]|uniref:Uncharacterized protein n=1 Tax=Roridomyces roridus TaxID=1738132 RepID=A0AAD7AYQ1_9AGAR|nr:hypothetical protein FB45DRAFT_955684 [Roridomyces roridus]
MYLVLFARHAYPHPQLLQGIIMTETMLDEIMGRMSYAGRNLAPSSCPVAPPFYQLLGALCIANGVEAVTKWMVETLTPLIEFGINARNMYVSAKEAQQEARNPKKDKERSRKPVSQQHVSKAEAHEIRKDLKFIRAVYELVHGSQGDTKFPTDSNDDVTLYSLEEALPEDEEMDGPDARQWGDVDNDSVRSSMASPRRARIEDDESSVASLPRPTRMSATLLAVPF